MIAPSNATHSSNQSKDGTSPIYKMMLEDGHSVFKKEHFYNKIYELLFLIRENPKLASEFWFFVQEQPSLAYEKRIGDKHHLRLDLSIVEHMTQLFLDNPFIETAKTQDTNLMFFNTLRTFHIFINDTTH